MFAKSYMIGGGLDNICKVCLGWGKNLIEDKCSFCHGTGDFNREAESFIKYHKCKMDPATGLCIICLHAPMMKT